MRASTSIHVWDERLQATDLDDEGYVVGFDGVDLYLSNEAAFSLLIELQKAIQKRESKQCATTT